MLFTPLVLVWPLLTIGLAIIIILNLKKPLVKGILSKFQLVVTIIGNTAFILAFSINFITLRLEIFVSGFYYIIFTGIALYLFIKARKLYSSIHSNISSLLFLINPFVSFLILWLLGIYFDK